MKRGTLLVSVAVAAVAVGGGWYWLHHGSPLQQANRMLADGNVRGAQLTLRSAVLQHPRDAAAHYMLAGVELRSADPVAAEREARAAGQLGYDPAAVRTVLASAVLQQRRYDDVLRDFQPDPSMTSAEAASILVQRGLATFAQGNADDAAATIATAQERDPQSFEAAMAAARIAQARHDLTTARSQIDTALRISPGDPQALLLRGVLMVAAGDQQGALASYDSALTRAPNSLQTRLARADLLTAMGRNDAARQDLDSVLRAQPLSPMANFLLARLLMRTGDWPGADAALDRAAPALDSMPLSHLYVAMVKAHVNQPQQALDAAERYLQHPEGNDLLAAKLVAELSLRTGQPSRAVAVLQSRLQAGDADVATLRMLALADQQTGRGDLALPVLERAAAAAPHDQAVQTELAAARLSAGSAGAGAGATGDLQRALDLQQVSLTSAAPATPGIATPGAAPSGADAAVAEIGAAVRAGDTARADAALQRISHMKDIDPARLDLLTGLVMLAKADLAGAHAAFAAAAQLRPTDAGPQVELARVMAMQGDQAQAEQLLEHLADSAPSDALVATALETMLVSDHKLDEAVSRMAAAHAAAPANQSLSAALMQLYVQAGKPKLALALLDAITAQAGDAGAPQMLEVRSRLQVQAGDLQGATATLRQALTKQPNDPALAVALARTLLAADHADDATTAVRDALKANPGNAALLNAMVSIAARQGLASGLAMADQLAQDKTNLPAAVQLKGDLLLQNRRTAEALAAFQSAAATAPSSPLTIRIATAQQALGQHDAAAATLRGFLATHPDAADVTEVLATLDTADKKFDAARTEFNQVLAQHPDDPVALNNLAWIEQQSDNLPQARRLAQHAYMVQPAAQSADTLGWIIYRQGDAKDALPLLQQAADSMKTDPTVQYHLAAAMDKAGRPAEAVAILTPIAARPGDFEDKDSATRLLKSLTRH